MEQQNRQSMQERMENKLPVRTNWKFIAIVAVLGLVVGAGILLYRSSDIRKQEIQVSQQQGKNQTSRVSPKETKREEVKIPTGVCSYYGFLPKETYLEKYTVQSGDTLLSIAKKQLGNTTRVGELAFLNYKQYPSLYTDYTSIQVRWELYLPPKFLVGTSGSLTGYAGQLVKGTYGLELAINPHDYSEGQRTAFNVWNDTLYFGEFTKNKPIEGDCVMFIVDTLPGHIALAVSPQDRIDYFKDPKALFAIKDYGSFVSYNPISPCGFESLKKYGFWKYIVQPGDTLNSIAQKQLGNSNRAVEIREINTTRYSNLSQEGWAPKLYGATDFLEIGWELVLPPRNPDEGALKQTAACWYRLSVQN